MEDSVKRPVTIPTGIPKGKTSRMRETENMKGKQPQGFPK